METAVEHLEENKVKISVEIDAHDVDHAFEHALADMAKDVRVPGFRPGKTPIAVVRQRVGEEALAEEALRSHINGWWTRACSAAAIDATGAGRYLIYSDTPANTTKGGLTGAGA